MNFTIVVRALPQLIAITAALILGVFVIAASGKDPIQVYSVMVSGAFGDILAIANTLTQMTPIVFTGLAFLIAFKTGLFNIGIEGQFYIGAFVAAYVGFTFPGFPPVLHSFFALLAGGVAGAFWALLAIVPKIKTGAHEVITSLMLTYVAILITGYLVNYPFKAVGWAPYSPYIAPTAELPRLIPYTQLSVALVLAIVIAALVYLILWKTPLGYEIRVVGLNIDAARTSGIRIEKIMVISFVLSGFLGGLGGACEILGVHRRFIEHFSPGYGWDGIAVGLLGGLHPAGVIFAALMIGALRAGGNVVQVVTKIPLDMVTMIQGIIVLFLSMPLLYRYIRTRLEMRT